MRNSRHRELRQVRSSTVHRNNKVFTRKSHTRNVQVSSETHAMFNKKIEKSKQIKDIVDKDISSKKLDARHVVGEIDGGTSNGTRKLEVDNEHLYHKPIYGENITIYDSRFSRNAVKLNRPTDRNTQRVLSLQTTLDIYRKIKENPNYLVTHGEDIKGFQIHRELASKALAKKLGLDHIPDVGINSVKIGGKKHFGLLSKDIRQKATDKQATSLADSGLRYEDLSLNDRRYGDKVIFDYLIGNSDRHIENTYVDKNFKMLGIDMGLSFPIQNKYYFGSGFMGHPTNQAQFNKAAEWHNHVITDELISRLNEIRSSDIGNFEQYVEYIADNIGKSEAIAFIYRLSKLYQFISSGKNTIKDFNDYIITNTQIQD